ncbi:hypothetical protein K438DRAFT_517300 [Mycena galopus ATCC 62051]|nr:hypothetical protein K438DRAFT_517300 [Mycena galopus ATCC 62051]
MNLAFKMMAGLAAGLNHLSIQGLPLGIAGVKNFDVLFDVNDQFRIVIHPPEEGDTENHPPADSQEREESAWVAFTELCQRILISANRALYHEQLDRDPEILDALRQISGIQPSDNIAVLFSVSQPNHGEGVGALPQREFVLRTLDRDKQSLGAVARSIALELEMDPSLRRIQQSPHRGAGYVHEEITPATTPLDDAVVADDVPSPKVIFPEIVGMDERIPLLVHGKPLNVRCANSGATGTVSEIRRMAPLVGAACPYQWQIIISSGIISSRVRDLLISMVRESLLRARTPFLTFPRRHGR